MARSPKQKAVANQIQTIADNKKIEILHGVLGIITYECELKALSDESEIQYWLSVEKFKPDFEVSTRELLDTLDSSLFPVDAIHKISDHYFKCVIDAAGGMTNQSWFSVDMSNVRKQLFMNLIGITDDPVHVESCRVSKEKSILNSKSVIRINL